MKDVTFLKHFFQVISEQLDHCKELFGVLGENNSKLLHPINLGGDRWPREQKIDPGFCDQLSLFWKIMWNFISGLSEPCNRVPLEFVSL